MLGLLRTLTPGLLALCPLSLAQATQTAPPGTNTSEINKAAHSSEEERAAKKKGLPIGQTADTGSRLLGSSSTVHRVGGKRPVTAEAYDLWNGIEESALSKDAKWVTYTLRSGAGHGDLIVRATQNGTELRVPRGLGTGPAQITADSRFVVFSINTSPATETQDHEAQETLGIVSLPGGSVTKVPGVSSYITPPAPSPYIAYTLRNDPAEASPARGKTLVLRHLITGAEARIPDASEFTFDPKGRYLAYTQDAVKREESGVYVHRLADGRVTPIMTGEGSYRSLHFDASGQQLAFLSDRDSLDGPVRRFSVYYASSPQRAAQPAVKATALAQGMVISPDAGVKFSRAGNALIFSISPFTPDEPAPEPSSEEAKYEIWYWTEIEPFPQGAPPKPPGPYLAVYHIAQRHWTQLGSTTAPDVLLSDDARYAVGIDRTPYRVQNTWDLPTADVYEIDVMSGEPREIRRELRSTLDSLVSLSLTGRYLLYFDNRRWFSYDLARDNLLDLTGALLPTTRFDSDAALPENPPEGIAGWVGKDQRVLLYDRHDIWEIDPSGTVPPRNLTDGVGRKENIRFRLWADYDRTPGPPEEAKSSSDWRRPVDPATPLLLAALDQDTMASGVWRDRVGALGKPEPLLMVDKRVRPIAHVAETTQYLLTMETFREFPDLWTGSRLDRLQKISNANPQQRQYRWGSVELIPFTSSLAVPLKARLYKPEGFDPSRQYPLIVSINERESDKLHLHAVPEPLTTAVSAETAVPLFVSQGYVVLVPDVQPAVPYPGQSALASVVPAVQGMIQRRYIDPSRIALTGHGFGGYAVAYILTQTNLFRCAIESAGVTNMLSAYASLRSRALAFEKGMWRHGASIWEKPFVYLSNSPLLFADRVTTPLLIQHNDGNEDVPYDQGMELFFGLRRNGKEVYLLNYRHEGATLVQPDNQLDWDRRVHEFLNHYLKDAPKPGWFEFPLPEEERTHTDEAT